MTREEAEELVEGTEACFADGFDDCIMGVMQRAAAPMPLVAYSVPAILSKLVNQGLTPEEAQEHFDFNIVSAWVGDGTPIFIETGETLSIGGVTVWPPP